MKDEKSRYEPQASLPIPTYEEATSSRPPSSQSFLGPAEISHDAERQGLLDRGAPPPRNNNDYRPPTVESARSSLDFLPSSSESSARNSVEGLRREISEMEVIDPEGDGRQSQMGALLSKRLSNFRSSLNLPFRRWLPALNGIRGRLPTIPEGYLPGWIMVIRIFALIFVLALAYLVFFTRVFRVRPHGQSYTEENVRMYIQEHINETRIMENLEHATQWDHIAGTEGSFFLAKWIEAEMKAAELDKIELERFDVYLNYPRKDGRRVAIVSPPEKVWEAKLEEEKAYPDREQTMVFHGHSRSGNVTGPLVYANYGSREDFKKLETKGIRLKGTIALVRYYGSQGDRALKVKAAELAGAAGCIIYSDPKEDGFIKGKPFPAGRFRPADSVQRGAVSLMSWITGDPLSPGFPSLPGGDRKSKDNNPGLNNIPSLPLSWQDAKPLLQSLKGHGEKLTDQDWVGGVPDTEWWTGDEKSPIVHLMNTQDEVERRPIYNILGKIDGIEQKEKSVIVGNHYDAWCFGAVDPGSGTAVLLEVMRVFGDLKKLGWRPRRSIEFMAWDAEEYNLVGSTEHVEARIDDLRKNGFAYINVDVAVLGDDFHAGASPLYKKALMHALKGTADPKTGKTLWELWETKNKKLDGLGAGSDYVAFQDLAGVSSIDMGFGGPQFPYHSCYDNFEWMSSQGDPGFVYHKALAQVWSFLLLQLADEPLLPFDLEAYAMAVKGYIKDLETYASEKKKEEKDNKAAGVFSLKILNDAADTFTKNAKLFHDWDRSWTRTWTATGQGFESNGMAAERLRHNTKMADFETNLLDINGGLPGREQFKHVIFAPQAWSGYDEAFFPGPRDAIDAGDWKAAQGQVDKVARILKEASEKLLQ